MKSKICSTCNVEKPIEFFAKSLSYKDGHRGQCRPCRSYVNRRYKKRPKDTAPEGFKTCSACNEVKPIDAFTKHYTGVDGRRRQCSPCVNKKQREYSKTYKRPRNYHYMSQRNFSLKKKYGIDHKGYEAILATQNGGCALCGRPADIGKNLCVDHCHESGRVRGVLCARCNKAIAVLGDNEGGLWRAFNYVAKPIGTVS